MTNKNLTAIVALLLIPLSGMATDIYVPSLPELTRYFVTTPYLAQLTVSAYLLGYAFSQVFSGVVVDIVGTKRTSVISLFIFIVLTIAIILVPNIDMVCACRMLQGISVGFFAVAQRAIMPNLFKDNPAKMHNMINYSLIAWSIGPIIAPVIGGYLQHFFSWKFSFGFLSCYAFGLWLMIVFFTQEAIENRAQLHIAKIKVSYSTILGSKQFILNVLCLSIIYSLAVLFATLGSFAIQVQLHHSVIFFGYCSLAMGFTWFVGSLANRFIKRLNYQRKMIICLWIMIAIYIGAIVFNLYIYNAYIFIGAIIIANIFAGIIFSSCYAVNLSMFPQYAGNAAGLMSAVLIFITAVITASFNKLLLNYPPIMMVVLNLFLVLICYLLTKLQKTNVAR